MNQERLIELFEYNKNGYFLWKNDNKHNKLKGIRCGTKIDGYIIIKIDGKQYREHRLVWLYHTGELPSCQIDHINRIRDDNRIENLRLCPNNNKENGQNRNLNKNNKSGHKGVTWHKSINRWISYIRVENKLIHLGSFSCIDDAIKSRKKAEEEYFTYV
jgi:hypothetical protein